MDLARVHRLASPLQRGGGFRLCVAVRTEPAFGCRAHPSVGGMGYDTRRCDGRARCVRLAPALARSRAQPRPAGNSGSMDANSLEMAYWGAIKDSKNPSDFRAYVTKFPSGVFVELANSRISALESEAREHEKAKADTEASERARNSHVFDVLDASRTAGTLTVTPGAIAFEVNQAGRAGTIRIRASACQPLSYACEWQG